MVTFVVLEREEGRGWEWEISREEDRVKALLHMLWHACGVAGRRVCRWTALVGCRDWEFEQDGEGGGQLQRA